MKKEFKRKFDRWLIKYDFEIGAVLAVIVFGILLGVVKWLLEK